MSPLLETGAALLVVLIGSHSVALVVLLWRSPRRLAEALVEPLTREPGA